MKVYANLFEQIINPENLFSAWDIFHRGKGHKKDVQWFEKGLEQNLFELARELRSHTYRHGAYTAFRIYDPKLRNVHKATVRDRVLHHAVFRILNAVYEPVFITNSFSCRVGKGTHKGVDKLTEILRQVSRNNRQTCYALKCDIKKFFDSVDHAILLEILGYRIKDADVMWLLREIISSYPDTSRVSGGGASRFCALVYRSAISPASFSPMSI